jgi:tetratricopeptide (TPR) repeat protein
MLPTLIKYAKIFSRVAIGLDKRPELIQHLVAVSITEDGKRESLPEKAANIVRQAFITCLNDRNTVPGGIKNNKPDGKKTGIYKMANICLKILFQAEKLESCQTIFNNINNSSPPLHIYPASERVTYLYYLGRYHFANTNFYEAQLCLQKAYDDSPSNAACVSQRRLILIYLIAANILLGRFPSAAIYTLPEAYGLRGRFEPITRAIRRGDLESFRRITNLDLSHEHAAWFSKYRMFYQLGNYCEVYIWRSLFRKVFLLTGQLGATIKSAPTIDLNAVLLAFQYFERRSHMTAAMAQQDQGPGRRHISFVLQDFTPRGYVDPDFEGLDVEPYTKTYDILEMESICSSLIVQGFLNGYISHKSKRFAIIGARKGGGPLRAGFPNIWETISKRKNQNVQGWRKEALSEAGGGGVIRLAGARPAGS